MKRRRVLLVAGPLTTCEQRYYALVDADISVGAGAQSGFCHARLCPRAILRLGHGEGRLYGGSDVDVWRDRLLRELEITGGTNDETRA